MKEENVRQVLQIVNGKLPEDKIIVLKNKLEAVSDDKVDAIMCASLYNPTHILLFSVFLGGFGVDRFMIGDTGFGIAKLLFGWVTCGIWPIIDIFISYKKAKEKNFNTVMSIL
ncbi:MAG: TM2 domain-containing protein [Clostridia bacterium]|nr:TM2 domain-containing protein [Clostridia bacterium]